MKRIRELARWMMRPGGTMTAALAVLSAILLTAIFLNGWEESTLAYIVYPLSVWALTAVAAWSLDAGRSIRRRVESSAAGRIIKDESARRMISMRSGLGISLLYALFKLAGGFVYRSAWLSAVAIYYIVLSVMRYLLLRYEKKNAMDEQWIFRLTGALLGLLGMTMIGMAVQMVCDGRAYDYPGHMIYASAAYTFYSLITAVIQLIRRRKECGAAKRAARMLTCAVALMAIYALQTGMIDRFGTGEELFRRRMNSMTGAVVCSSTIGMGVYMLMGGRKKTKFPCRFNRHHDQ